MPSPFRPQVDTTDPEDARIRITHSYCPHRLTLPARAKDFRAEQLAGGVDDLAVYMLSYGPGTTQVDPVPFDRFVLISRPIRGRFAVRVGDKERVLPTGEPVALDAYTAYHMRWLDNCRLLTIRIDRTEFEQTVAELRGADAPSAIRFPLDTGKRSLAAWDALTRFLLREVLPARLLNSMPLLRSQLVRMMIACVLDTYPSLTEPVSEHTDGLRGPGAVRRATAYIEASAGEDIRITDIAAAARLSPRALQEAFRKHMNTTPMAYLKAERMRRAHADLQHSCPEEGMTVATVAYRWGFSNLGRFAADYRQAFGHSPSHVLRSDRETKPAR